PRFREGSSHASAMLLCTINRDIRVFAIWQNVDDQVRDYNLIVRKSKRLCNRTAFAADSERNCTAEVCRTKVCAVTALTEFLDDARCSGRSERQLIISRARLPEEPESRAQTDFQVPVDTTRHRARTNQHRTSASPRVVN